MIRSSMFALGLALLAFSVMASAQPGVPAADPVPGGIAIVALGEGAAPPRASYRGKRVMVQRRGGEWVAVVGIPLSAKPGEHRLRVEGDAGEPATRHFEVATREYAEQRLTIKNKRKVNPYAEDMKRIRRETKEIRAALAAWRDTDPLSEGFLKPVDGPYSSPFGLRRFLNEQPRSPHSGIDIAAPEGAPIRSPAAGTVTAVGDYFFNGRTVILDHGQGLVSMFAHMSRIDVSPGQTVARGEVLGAVGMTGRVTGPHLHWGVSLNDARINPKLFMPTEVAEGGMRDEGIKSQASSRE